MKTNSLAARLGLCAALLGAACSASAALVTTRGALGADDFIDWGQVTPYDPNNPTALTLPVAVTSNLARSASVTNTASGGELYRFNEGDGVFGGLFTTGDALLFTLFTNGPIVIDFAALTGAAGAQVYAGAGVAFRAVITALDSGGGVLESHTVDAPGGDPANYGDGTAPFLGISRTSNDIDKVLFSVLFPNNQQQTDFSVAINRLSFGPAASQPGGGGGGNVPLPPSLPLVLMASALAFGVRRKQG